MADIDTVLSPELQRLLLLVESNVHYIVRHEHLTREEAMDIKQRLTRPLGVLNSRFGFRSEAEAKRVVRNNR